MLKPFETHVKNLCLSVLKEKVLCVLINKLVCGERLETVIRIHQFECRLEQRARLWLILALFTSPGFFFSRL